MSRQFWTDEERAVLKKLIESGCNMREVMAVLKDRDDGQIRGQMKRTGLKFRIPGGEVDYEAFKRILKNRGEVIECG